MKVTQDMIDAAIKAAPPLGLARESMPRVIKAALAVMPHQQDATGDDILRELVELKKIASDSWRAYEYRARKVVAWRRAFAYFHEVFDDEAEANIEPARPTAFTLHAVFSHGASFEVKCGRSNGTLTFSRLVDAQNWIRLRADGPRHYDAEGKLICL